MYSLRQDLMGSIQIRAPYVTFVGINGRLLVYNMDKPKEIVRFELPLYHAGEHSDNHDSDHRNHTQHLVLRTYITAENTIYVMT